jgi:hypothetical protein
LVPYLEENRFGCNLYVDKIYIYRTCKLAELKSSYLWHYDNNPLEIVKNIIYLNKVTEDNSPFEYLSHKDGKAVIVNPTRTGPRDWRPPPNNSRVTKQELKGLINEHGCKPVKVCGDLGLTYSFNNNAVHKVNPIIKGYRDVVNIRVKPCLDKPPRYIDPKWTSGFEKTGAVISNPQITWKY